ncbi:MAG: YcgL domain-containing protein [Granulosicoccus sp.]|nr:YcgL domain-containing protein [Granulosicoccus sp.]
MQCYIYRSSIKEGLYVYLSEKDSLEQLPDPVKKQLGNAEFCMALDLQPDRKLGQEDTKTVLENLSAQGYHLQMPKDIESLLQSISSHTTLRKQRPTNL